MRSSAKETAKLRQKNNPLWESLLKEFAEVLETPLPDVYPLPILARAPYACDVPLSRGPRSSNVFRSFKILNLTSVREIHLPISGFTEEIKFPNGMVIPNQHAFPELFFDKMEERVSNEMGPYSIIVHPSLPHSSHFYISKVDDITEWILLELL